MIEDPTVEGVQAIVARIADRGPVDVGPDTLLTEGGLELDSLRLLQTILACEETFRVAFDPDRDFTAETLETLRTLFDLIRSSCCGGLRTSARPDGCDPSALGSSCLSVGPVGGRAAFPGLSAAPGC